MNSQERIYNCIIKCVSCHDAVLLAPRSFSRTKVLDRCTFVTNILHPLAIVGLDIVARWFTERIVRFSLADGAFDVRFRLTL